MLDPNTYSVPDREPDPEPECIGSGTAKAKNYSSCCSGSTKLPLRPTQGAKLATVFLRGCISDLGPVGM
jgi:hypothetical protein